MVLDLLWRRCEANLIRSLDIDTLPTMEVRVKFTGLIGFQVSFEVSSRLPSSCVVLFWNRIELLELLVSVLFYGEGAHIVELMNCVEHYYDRASCSDLKWLYLTCYSFAKKKKRHRISMYYSYIDSYTAPT